MIPIFRVVEYEDLGIANVQYLARTIDNIDGMYVRTSKAHKVPQKRTRRRSKVS